MSKVVYLRVGEDEIEVGRKDSGGVVSYRVYYPISRYSRTRAVTLIGSLFFRDIGDGIDLEVGLVWYR